MIIAELLIWIVFPIISNGDFFQHSDGALQGACINSLDDNGGSGLPNTCMSGLKRLKLSLMLLTTTADVNYQNRERRRRMEKCEEGELRNEGLWKRSYVNSSFQLVYLWPALH